MVHRERNLCKIMENPGMFDIEQAIARWRETMSLSSAIPRHDVDELEFHLRDSMRVLENQGLSNEEAFWVGTHRLGPIGKLQDEFSKVNSQELWLERALWIVVGSLLFTFVSSVASLAASITTLGLHLAEVPRGLLGPAGSVLHVFTLIALFGCPILLARRKHPAFLSWMKGHRALSAVGAVLILIASFVANSGVSLFAAKMVPISVYGEMVQWRIGAAIFAIVALPIALMLLLRKIDCARGCE